MEELQRDQDGTYYGMQFLVDFKPIEEADILLAECKKFVQEAKLEPLVIPYVPPFAIIAQNIRSWRLKRRDSRLNTTYDALQPRIANCERILRRIIGEVVEKKAILRLQARQLLSRLDECVKYNKDLLGSTDAPLAEARMFVNVLSNESSILKVMVTFNKEVVRLKASQEMNKSPALLRWGMQKSKGWIEVDYGKDEDHIMMEVKLLQYRELRKRFMDHLGYILERRGVQQSNLDNCLWSMDAIRAAIRRDGIYEDSNSDIHLEDPFSDAKFDHSRCVDCSYGYSITCECMSHLSTLQKQAHDANKRLQALVEIREQMTEATELMNQQLQADGPQRDSTIWNESQVSHENHSVKISKES